MNCFDFCIIILDLIMNIVELVAGDGFSVSVFRIVRLCKLARVAQAFHVCQELRLLLAGLIGCLKAIFWGTVLLVLFLVIWSVIAVQFLHPLNQKLADKGEYGDCERCARVYSTVWQACLLFFQQIVAGDGWGMVTVTVIEHHPETIMIYGPLFLSVGLAVLNLILGVVVDVASQARASLQGEMEAEKVLSRKELRHQLMTTCKSMDTDGSGKIDLQELKRGYAEKPQFRESLAGIGITEEDLDIVWTILDDDKAGSIAYEHFVAYCYKMKTSHVDFMLAYIKYYVTVIKAQIVEEIQLVTAELKGEDEKIAIMQAELMTQEKHLADDMDQVINTEKETQKENQVFRRSCSKMFCDDMQAENESQEDNASQEETQVSCTGATPSQKATTRDAAVSRPTPQAAGVSALMPGPPSQKSTKNLLWDLHQCAQVQQSEFLGILQDMRQKLDCMVQAEQLPASSPPSLISGLAEIKSKLDGMSMNPHLAERPTTPQPITPKGPSPIRTSEVGFGLMSRSCCGNSARVEVKQVRSDSPRERL